MIVYIRLENGDGELGTWEQGMDTTNHEMARKMWLQQSYKINNYKI